MGNSHKNHLVQNQQLNQNQTLMEQSLDGPLPKLCLAVAISHRDGRHSAVALLLKAALIQVSDYRLLGASGFYKFDTVLLGHSLNLLFYILNIARLVSTTSVILKLIKVPYRQCSFLYCKKGEQIRNIGKAVFLLQINKINFKI